MKFTQIILIACVSFVALTCIVVYTNIHASNGRESQVRTPNTTIQSQIENVVMMKPHKVSLTFNPDCQFDSIESVSTTDPEEMREIAAALAKSSRAGQLPEPLHPGKENMVTITFHSSSDLLKEFFIIVPTINADFGGSVRGIVEKYMPRGWAIYVSEKSIHHPDEILGPE